MAGKRLKSPIWAISKEEFQNLFDTYPSSRQILKFFNLDNRGGNFKTLKRRIIRKFLQ